MYTNAFRKSAVSVSAAIESVMIFWFGSAYHASLLVHLPELWPDERTETLKVEAADKLNGSFVLVTL